MYSRNTWEKKDSYSLPPGYDGSRFRRRRHRNESGHAEEEVVIVPDSSYAAAEEESAEVPRDSGELSVGGIPTNIGIQKQRRRSAFAEDTPAVTDSGESSDTFTEESASVAASADTPPAKEKLSGILEKLGFSGGLSSDELLLCAVIFIIASDTKREEGSVGDILLILALLLGIR